MSICLPFFFAGAFFLGATCSARAKRSSAISGADSVSGSGVSSASFWRASARSESLMVV